MYAMETAPNVIARALRQEIDDGVIVPGSALNQVHLAERFGVSRVPVREALHRLEAEGLISQAPHKRARVASVTDEATVTESLEIREALEPVLMREVVRRIGNDALDRAADLLRSLNDETDIAKLRGMHGDFHAVLYAAAQRPQMASIISSHRYRFDLNPLREAEQLGAFIRAARPIHRNLLKACHARKVDALIRCVREEAELGRRLFSERTQNEA
jgi:DNA-binding GntR family transcriptional regulator